MHAPSQRQKPCRNGGMAKCHPLEAAAVGPKAAPMPLCGTSIDGLGGACSFLERPGPPNVPLRRPFRWPLCPSSGQASHLGGGPTRSSTRSAADGAQVTNAKPTVRQPCPVPPHYDGVPCEERSGGLDRHQTFVHFFPLALDIQHRHRFTTLLFSRVPTTRPSHSVFASVPFPTIAAPHTLLPRVAT